MEEKRDLRKELMDEILARKKLGDKKFHSESSLQEFGEVESESLDPVTDPGVLNQTMNDAPTVEGLSERRRTMSQPGPGSGSLVTATAARAARRRPLRSVNYASDVENNETRQPPRLLIPGKGEESGSNTPVGGRSSPLPYGTRNGDVKSLNSYRLYTPQSEIRGGSTPRKRSVVTMDAQSIRSVETQAPPSTDPTQNKKLTIKYLMLILSTIYSILLVTLGLIIFLADIVFPQPIASIYALILNVVAFLYHIFLIVDIQRYKTIARKNEKIKNLHDEKIAEIFRKQEEDFLSNTLTERDYRQEIPSPVLIPLRHDYCFSQGRHSGSFYLKMGAAAFALGHLVHTVLQVAVQFAYYADETIINDECVDVLRLSLDVVDTIFTFVQLYFIFKYSNVIIMRAQGLALFGFMHMIGSSLCFWIMAIVRETVLALTIYAESVYGESADNDDSDEIDTDRSSSFIQNRFFDVKPLYDEKCSMGSASITSTLQSFSPYLYPFSVEFNILVVAVYFIIWSNIGNCDNENTNMDASETSSLSDTATVCKIPTANESNNFTSNIVIYADCHASSRGIFGGLLVIVVVVGMLIIGFVFNSGSEESIKVGYLLSNCTKLGLHVVMLFASTVAYSQTKKLDINEHPISLLDDILLFICLPAFFLETVLSLAATLSLNNIVYSVDFIVMFVQVIVQTPLIVDGLRRCSNSRKLRRAKPGRELLIFLIITNVAMWLFYTFSYKSPETNDERYTYYGKVAWSILGHISLPLIMFYRFHSSVCFADIWNSAYKPGSEH